MGAVGPETVCSPGTWRWLSVAAENAGARWDRVTGALCPCPAAGGSRTLCASRQNWGTASTERFAAVCRCVVPMFSLLEASLRPAAGPQGYMQATGTELLEAIGESACRAWELLVFLIFFKLKWLFLPICLNTGVSALYPVPGFCAGGG